MRDQLRSFLLGLGIVVGGWLLMIVIRLENEALLVTPVILGAAVALVARRPVALLGPVIGWVASYALNLATGSELGDGWQAYAVIFPVLLAAGFGGGLALLRLRSARRVAARS